MVYRIFLWMIFSWIFTIAPVLAEGLWTRYPVTGNMSSIGDIEIASDCIWLATSGGIVRMNPGNGTFSKYTVSYSAHDWYYTGQPW